MSAGVTNDRVDGETEEFTPAIIANYRRFIQEDKNEKGQYSFFAAIADDCLNCIERLRKREAGERLALERSDALMNILARPNFACHGLANALRKSGREIPTKAEAEQSEVIFWLLNLYIVHGDEWEKEAQRFLTDVATTQIEGQKP